MANDPRPLIDTLLEPAQNPLWRRAQAPIVATLARGFSDWPGEGVQIPADASPAAAQAYRLCLYLADEIAQRLRSIEALELRGHEFARRMTHALSDEERNAYLLDMAAALGATGAALREDRHALDRWLAEDAVRERLDARLAAGQRVIVASLEALARAIGVACAGIADVATAWKRLDLEALALKLHARPLDERVHRAVWSCLASALAALPPPLRASALSQAALQAAFRVASDRQQPVWVQVAALEALEQGSPVLTAQVLRDRLGGPDAGDDLFVRARCVPILLRLAPGNAELAALVPALFADPSVSVRQALARAITVAPVPSLALWQRLCCEDPAPQVRAAALLELPALRAAGVPLAALTGVFARVLTDETDLFVRRAALVALRRSLPVDAPADWQAAVDKVLDPVLGALHRAAPSLVLRREAAMLRQWLWALREPQRATRVAELRERLQGLAVGAAQRLPRGRSQDIEEPTLGRALALAVADDFGAEIERGVFITVLRRLPLLRLRAWRVLHEVLHPSPEKRQAHSHLRGRVFQGQVHAPSPILAELSETKVPGEPLHIPDEDGWRSYLPLVDEMISVLTADAPVRRYTAEGVTVITPPAGVFARLRAWTRLTTGFARFAQLRNWHTHDPRPANGYVSALRALGFGIEMLALPDDDGHAYPLDPSVQRFFEQG